MRERERELISEKEKRLIEKGQEREAQQNRNKNMAKREKGLIRQLGSSFH